MRSLSLPWSSYTIDRHIPLEEPIDLLNVAFENPRKVRVALEGNNPKKQNRKIQNDASKKALPVNYMVPDRKTGLEELEELQKLCPGRTWNFVRFLNVYLSHCVLTHCQVEVNVPFKVRSLVHQRVFITSLGLGMQRKERSCRITHVSKSHCDGSGKAIPRDSTRWPLTRVQSLALALYFASRGVGQVRADPNADPTPYTSSARVLLNGLGSDELLGGYGRHRSAFHAGGWQAVIEEVRTLQDPPVGRLNLTM